MDRLLVIGGANFIGLNLLLQLEKLGQYDITLFNRGQTNPDLFPSMKRILGDRNTDDILQIGQHSWDYIIDLSCYYPDSLSKILKVVSQTLKRYIFVSTCSVYDNSTTTSNIAKLENSLVLNCTKEEETTPFPAAYGNKKVACELLLATSGLDYISLRPSLVYGPFDYTNRLYYWLYQVKHNNPVLVPNHGTNLFSITYVGDLVNAIVESLSLQKHQPIYNIISDERMSIKKITDCACQLLHKKPTFKSLSPSLLQEHNIRAWMDMPLWIDGNHFLFSNQQQQRDFSFALCDWEKSMEETIAYYDYLGWPLPSYGISEEVRLALLACCE